VSAQLKQMALRQCSTRLIDAYSCRPCVSRIRNLRGETKIIIEIARTAARGLRRGWSERAMLNLGLAPKSPSTRMAALYSAFMCIKHIRTMFMITLEAVQERSVT